MLAIYLLLYLISYLLLLTLVLPLFPCHVIIICVGLAVDEPVVQPSFVHGSVERETTPLITLYKAYQNEASRLLNTVCAKKKVT